ncbi:methyltransferase RsmF C-terminal domain-like protein [Rhodopirellula halodulae]|uniref:methyltransferase RsmF C-terminal domain-like protein n=1 Tax=Rhodopirellula halodulae TaxID=2894198 RepID=UPI001E29FA50|nr:SAM-dependent methyltransferase [Rhodopirellula sp. JC737]MCC9654474.1 SAM-dependent methyltransferase [Rhodopirellula sp. JC737]
MSRSRKGSKKGNRRSAGAKSSGTRRPLEFTADQMAAAIAPIELPVDELERLATAMTQRHPNVLRWRRDRLPSEVESSDSPPHCVPWYPLATAIPEGYPASRSIGFASGDFYLQDAGSLLALAVAKADVSWLRGKVVCDLCAAPGGKASGLLEAVGDEGFLLANEPIQSRLAPLAFNLARSGSDRYAISGQDPDQLAEKLPGVFDVVLVDAPCSGQALLSRGRQSKGAINESMIATNAARQQRILSAAERLLRPGGTLVYSTCTFAVAENEDQVSWMTSELELQPSPVDGLASYQSPLIEAAYRVWPHRDSCAGAFAARLSKPIAVEDNEEASFAEEPWMLRRGILQSEQPLDASCEELVRDVYGEQPIIDWAEHDAGFLRQRDWIAEAFCHNAPEWVKQDWTIGPEVAYRTGQTWKPSHAGAQRNVGNRFCQSVERIELGDQDAVAYLGGGTVPTEHRGWAIVQHAGRPLGWVKADGRIGKNHLPAHARIQVQATESPWAHATSP